MQTGERILSSSKRCSLCGTLPLLMLLVAVDGGCWADEEGRPFSPPPLPPVIRSTFLCEDGRDLEVTFHTIDPLRVVIVAGRRTIELPQALSASGARYSDGVTTFWNKGDQALFEWANGATHCRVRH